MTVTFTLDPETERRLEAVMAKTGQSREQQLREIVERGLEEAEDYYDAVETWKRIQSGEEPTYPLEEVRRRLGLDD